MRQRASRWASTKSVRVDYNEIECGELAPTSFNVNRAPVTSVQTP